MFAFHLIHTVHRMTGGRGKVHAFDTSTLANIMSLDIAYVTAYLTGKNVDVFSKDLLLLPFEKDRHYSIFVVCLGDRPYILHLNPLGFKSTHDTRYISHKIRSWLNSMWRHKFDRMGCTYDNPYNKRSMPDCLPEGTCDICGIVGSTFIYPQPVLANRSASRQRYGFVRDVRPKICTLCAQFEPPCGNNGRRQRQLSKHR